MSKNKKIVAIALAMFIAAVFVIPGCQKDTTVYIPLKVQEITDSVHFAADIVPIFSKNCALSGCHVKGSRAPDLTADNAYNSLTNGNYINKTDPESSILYKRLTGVLTPAMPMGATPNPSNIDALVLAWIKQGAKKN